MEYTPKNKQEIYDYLGIEPTIYTTKQDKKILKDIIQEYKTLQEKYKNNSDYELCFIDDLGLYIEFNEIIYQGEYIAVFKQKEHL